MLRQGHVRLSKAVQLLFKVLRSRPAFLTNAVFLQWADRFVFIAGHPGLWEPPADLPSALEEILEGLVQKGLITEAELIAVWIETLEKYGEGIAGYGEILDCLRKRPTGTAAPSAPRKPSTGDVRFPG